MVRMKLVGTVTERYVPGKGRSGKRCSSTSRYGGEGQLGISVMTMGTHLRASPFPPVQLLNRAPYRLFLYRAHNDIIKCPTTAIHQYSPSRRFQCCDRGWSAAAGYVGYMQSRYAYIQDILDVRDSAALPKRTN